MIAICSLVGGGGKYSSLEHGMTSTGRSSDRSGHECRYGFEVSPGPSRFQSLTAVTSNAPRMNGWMRQK